MAGFIYNGKSTDTILNSSKLVLCTYDSISSITGSERESVSGETTIVRPIVNEYGTKYSTYTFSYALVKANNKIFTVDDQVAVERWLTSPKFSMDLQTTDCDGNVKAIYNGKFISTEWHTGGGGFTGVTFTFENNGVYPKKHYKKTYQITTNGTIELECESDELEEYVYPILTVTQPNKTETVKLTNVTDNSNTMTIRALHKLPEIFDCKNCIPTDGTTSTVITYSDLGWEDVGNIYWMRLLPGINEITVSGTVNVTFEYDTVYKRVGAWI